ncbi:Clavaminate synthase-like protein [Pisolithus microcarpus]|nr:Clavaminate synthase-like protein [Pisolithus microcarpus]
MSNLSETLPVIDTKLHSSIQEECKKAADALVTYGALLLHDFPGDYFSQPLADLSQDQRPELSYQVGVTLENTEKPKCAVDEPCLNVIARLDPSERPLDISGHYPDPKCRFFWKMSTPPPYKTDYPAPQNFNGIWESVMEKWGRSMKDAYALTVTPFIHILKTEMVAIGLGLPRQTFKDAGQYGPHLLAPTASDLTKYGQKDTILAGFHTDLNCLTIHGRSRFPGLNIWARNTGKRISVRFPPTGRFLLVQSGKQIEHLTAGLIKAGYHEVVVNDATIQTIAKRKVNRPDRPLIRISSTFFWHLSSDYDLAPISSLLGRAKSLHATESEASLEGLYPSMKVGQQVQNELKHIALMA